MSALPKPQHCGQDWLAMSPAENGRLCGQCDKVIHDFSRMSWAEIEQRQQAHGNALCGMYSPAQLTYWGQEPPNASGACARLTAATTLALTLSALSALAQTGSAKTAGSITVRGTVYQSLKMGRRQPLPGVTVLLKGTQLGISSSDDGQYELSVPNTVAAGAHGTLVISSVGYLSREVPLDSLPVSSTNVVVHDIQLAVDDRPLAAFYVRRPTLVRRIWWAVTGWFRRES